MRRSLLGAGLLAAALLGILAAAQTPRRTSEEAYRANNLGVARLEQYEYAAAAAEFRRALDIGGLPLARLNLALALYYTGDLDGARKEAEAARADIGGRPHPHYVLGLIAREEDRASDALAHFEQVRKLDPDDPGTSVNIGQLGLQNGQYAEAREAFASAMRAEPYNATAAYGLAMALIRSGARERGTEAMQRFQRLRDSGYATVFARNYLEQGRYAEAIVSTGAEPELVDERVPDVTFRPEPIAADVTKPGGVTLVDSDRDRALDLIVGHAGGVRLLRNEQGTFRDASAGSSFPDVETRAALAGDYDNDGLVDLCLLTARGVLLLRQEAGGRFTRVEAAGLDYGHAPGAAAWLDVDHDGDVDLYVGGGSDDAPARLFRNNGNGSFNDVTEASRLAYRGRVLAAVATDYDNRRDIDLIVGPAVGAPLVFRNLRDGTFGESAAAVGLTAGTAGVIAAGDVNKDGFTDFFFGSAREAPLALSNGRGEFRNSNAPGAIGPVRAAQFLDYDNDGLLDLVVVNGSGIRVIRNVGSRWMDVTETALGRTATPDAAGMSAVAAGDIDSDGDLDLVTAGERLVLWRNSSGRGRHSVRTQLSARVSNRSAIGAKVEVRAGSLLQKLELYSSWPAPAPADLVFGLGDRSAADVVRVLWPAGILQAEIPPSGAGQRSTVVIEELDRKPSSCPYLYTWNGTRFEFITDFLGGGEMGYWLAPGLRNTPDPDEYIRIDPSQLAERGGRYELRITNELEEALFLDRAQLLVIDHPAGVEVHPAEGMTSPPRRFELFYAGDPVKPLRAVDDHGHDVLDRIAEVDRRYPDDFALQRIRGYAAPHSLELTLPAGERRLLLLTGWTDYAFSGDNVAAHQAGLTLVPPSLEVKDSRGGWRRAIDNIGFPVGRPQTIVVDLHEIPPDVREVRIATSMRVYWDRVRIARAQEPPAVASVRLEPLGADLRWRGFSAEVSADGREPYSYDYGRVTAASPWKLLPGRYTREGDVRELLTRSDDMFVIARPGDEIALSFDAAALPTLLAGRRRTFLLYADGFSKEMDLNSSSPDQLGPLPFHGMSAYPYGREERYPTSEAHRRYQERYNTRVVPRSIPSIELSTGRR